MPHPVVKGGKDQRGAELPFIELVRRFFVVGIDGRAQILAEGAGNACIEVVSPFRVDG